MDDGLIFEDPIPSNRPSSLPTKEKDPSHRANKRIIVIAGPTAVGKSRLSLELAKILDGEIISADSVQVYRGMDIGTAKVSLEDRLLIPHHLIDFCDLSDSFNVLRFYECARSACLDSLAANRVPILVGGTGFYLHALLYGPPKGPPASPEIRKQLEEDLKKFGPEALYDRLKHYDPIYAKTISLRDRHKIVRGLEIIALTGQKVSDFPRPNPSHFPLEFDFRCWFVYFPTDILYPRIEMRCDEMIAKDFVKEVQELEKKGLRENRSAAQAIGYRQCLDFLNSNRTDEDWEHFVWQFKKVSRRYAKRQFTWFRREKLFHWLDLDVHGYQKAIELILQDYESRY